MSEAVCVIVRVTAPTLRDAEAIAEIRAELRRRGADVPLVADVHHEGTKIAEEVARHVDKVRINPGLFVFRKRGPGYEYSEAEIEEARATIQAQLLPVIRVCYDILQALGLRRSKTEFIACPGCGRTKFDLPTVLNQVRASTGHLKGLNIAVMGCFPAGEKVVTAEGFAPIDTLSVGRQV